MSVLALVRTIGTLLALVGVGWALRASGLLLREDARPINAVIVYVGLPALIFQAVHPAELDWRLTGVAAAAWVAVAAAMLLGWGAARALRLPAIVTGGFLLAAALGNTGYIGYPVSLALLGEHALVQAIFFDVFGTVAALALVGVPVAQHFGDHGERRMNPLREFFGFPAVIALFVGLAFKPVAIPGMVSEGLDLLASMTVPLIMISVGLSLRMGAVRQFAVPLSILAVVKLLAAPLVAFAFGSLVLRNADATRLVTLQAGMPSMMLTLVVGTRFKLDTDFIASAILVTTVGCVVTIPLLQLLAG